MLSLVFPKLEDVLNPDITWEETSEEENCRCPHCHSLNTKEHHQYKTKNHGERTVYECLDCGTSFSETYGSLIAGLTTPLSEITRVLKARMEGMGLNAATRVFGFAKNTILNWERRLAGLQDILLLYAVIHEFLQLIIEGDELYTKVNKNTDPMDSEGWTIVLMERASRFIWTLECGAKTERLFLEAIAQIAELFDVTEALAFFSDGEKRYGKLIFDICHELLYTGKRGKPKKVLPKNFIMRRKNKSSQRRKSGNKLSKVETPKPEHPETTISIEDTDVHANHVEAFNSSLRRYLAAFHRRTNQYAKSTIGLQRVLDMFWIFHNFVKSHFTTKNVPAVALGILERGLSLNEIFQLRVI